MYWYIKYPLIIFLAFVVVGLSCVVVRSCSGKHGDKRVSPVEETMPETTTAQPTKTAAKTATKTVAKDTDGAALPAVEPVTATAPSEMTVQLSDDARSQIDRQLAMAKKQLESGALVAARRLAKLVLGTPGVVEFDGIWHQAVEILNDVNRRIMNSTAPAPEKRRYCVVRGDTLARIAANHFISMRSLERMNECLRRADGRSGIIVPSMTLMYIEGTWSIRVSKTHFMLMLYLNDQLYRCYTVGIGKEDRTPLGHFLITSQTINPAWTPPGRAPVPFGDPENVLGTRWMKLTPDVEKGTDPSLEGYGIHGTPLRESVGTNSSMGCVRMRNEEVEELYDFIPIAGGSTPPVRVTIEE